MKRSEAMKEQSHIRVRALGVALTALIAAAVLSGSCVLDTTTSLCEVSGRRCRPGQVCAANQDACIDVGGCGDGIVNGDEFCDDGNITDGDGCSANCLSNETCGNGTIDTAAGEGCDDGNVLAGDQCTPDCQSATCGNGVADIGEECDPGGVDSQGCDRDCTFVRCGDSHLNMAAGEQCDDGMAPSPTCNSPVFCKISRCGDGFRNPLSMEACDDGDLVDGDGCDTNCTVTGCGNGIRTGTEQCDDGNLIDGDNCDSNCTMTRCGNGIKTMGEQCDDGNLIDGDNCDSNCTMTGCGNFVQTGSEQCDDGNTVLEKCAYGATMCTVCNAICQQVPGMTSYCGDGIPDSGNAEVCDDYNNLACGSCGMGCHTTAAQATGSIVAIKANDLVNGETFTLSDGVNPPIIFEFRKSGTPAAGRIAVDISTPAPPPAPAPPPGPPNASQVRQAIINAINNAPSLDITATGILTVVTLTNERVASIGNVMLTETVADPDFSVTGMAGGSGTSCIAGVGCMDNKDCASLVCMNNVCQ